MTSLVGSLSTLRSLTRVDPSWTQACLLLLSLSTFFHFLPLSFFSCFLFCLDFFFLLLSLIYVVFSLFIFPFFLFMHVESFLFLFLFIYFPVYFTCRSLSFFPFPLVRFRIFTPYLFLFTASSKCFFVFFLFLNIC